MKNTGKIKASYLLLLFLTLSTSWALAQDQSTGKKSVRRVHCMGQSWKTTVFTTSDPEVVMFRADDNVLFQVGRALGRSLHWSSHDTMLTNSNGEGVALGQREISIEGQEVELQQIPQVIQGAVYVPSSSIEALLDCRVTVKKGSTGAIYVEPILESLSFSDSGEQATDLQLVTSVPVRKKVFTLSNPKRTVIDLVGVALPNKYPAEHHPVLGEVRVGQFQLAPSITRIVLPSDGGVKVKTKRSLDLFQHDLAITWPSWKKPVAKKPSPTRERPVAIKPVPPKAPGRAPVVVIKPQAPAATKPTAQKSKTPILEDVSWEGNRLKLSFDRPVEYQWSRVNTGKKRFVVDFPGVVFPDRKTKLSSAVPGLRSVRVVQNMPMPNPIVRVVCDLDSPLAVNPKASKEKILYLSFPGRRVSKSEYPRGFGHTSSKVIAGGGSGRVICIDAGHGGSDPGAINRSVGINEKTVTLDIALKLEKILKSQGWKVIMTRRSDRDVSWAGSSGKQELGARSGKANTYNADIFVSIHANASVNKDIHGTSIHWHKSSDYRLAQLMESGVMNATGRKNRGLVKNRFYVLAHTRMPAVLVETAFLTNNTEGRLLADPEYRSGIARGIASGLQVYAARTFKRASAKK